MQIIVSGSFFLWTYHLMPKGRKNHLNFIAHFYHLLLPMAGIEPGPPA